MKFLNKPAIIIFLIFIVKLFSVLFLVHLSKCDNSSDFMGIACVSGDAASYITPIDNFINEGEYYFQSSKAGRMPYLGLIYYPFRLLFSKEIALNIFVILQILLECIAIYFTALLCKNIFKSQTSFWFYVFLACINLYVTDYSYYILSESFSASFICLFVYNYYKYLTISRTNKQLFYTGFFLTLTILLKPYFALLFLIIGIEFIYFYRSKIFLKQNLLKIIIVASPILVLNAPWTILN